jgi:hypothetical protein
MPISEKLDLSSSARQIDFDHDGVSDDVESSRDASSV